MRPVAIGSEATLRAETRGFESIAHEGFAALLALALDVVDAAVSPLLCEALWTTSRHPNPFGSEELDTADGADVRVDALPLCVAPVERVPCAALWRSVPRRGSVACGGDVPPGLLATLGGEHVLAEVLASVNDGEIPDAVVGAVAVDVVDVMAGRNRPAKRDPLVTVEASPAG